MTTQQPLVSVVTPVYNGEQYLRECIESVQAQTYQHWEYIILNNCSTDRTAQIIQEYADADTRIKVSCNEQLLPIMDNWNAALQKISPNSVYCKVVHADDWLFPKCLASMVDLGEQHPTASIIGAYTQWGRRVACDGLPYPTQLISGREVCRQTLMRRTYPFLSPSALMIRAELIHNRDPFYPGPNLEADVDVLYELLKQYDFGFVPQILSFIRRHDSSATARLAAPLNTLLPQRLGLLIKHGPDFLSKDEYKEQVNLQLRKYYQFLAMSISKKCNKDFWTYHKDTLEKLGYPLSAIRLRIFWIFNLLNILKKRVEKIQISKMVKSRNTHMK